MTKSKDFNELYKAILSLSDEEECRLFFEDICTIKELETMSQRLEVAKLLSGGATFNEIVAKTGASTTTISRVNRCLNYGDGGYRRVIDKK
ncbi:MAG: hypothetical protein IJD91_04790 [Clostridia bacterium]|nr:hypothetical protein [Clostridia bacterium]